MKKIILIVTIISPLLITLIFSQCADKKSKNNPLPYLEKNRSFYMGFTPHPYDISLEAVEYTYSKIASDSDIIIHHFDNGVPWVEALSGDAFSDNIINDWNFRKAKTPANHKIVVQVAPLNTYRNNLAPYRGTKDNMPLPSPWDTYSLNHTDIKTAYLNYCKRIIEFFHPDFFNFAVEVNFLIQQDYTKWPQYVEFHHYVYTELKKIYPNLPIFCSFVGTALLEGYDSKSNHTNQMQGWNDIIDYTDYFTISIYVYLSTYSTNSIPGDMFDKLVKLSKNKPIAISETAYIGETLSINGGNIVIYSDENKQNEYVIMLLNNAHKYSFKFINYFAVRDYDPLWKKLGSTDFDALWKDTGLYDDNGNARMAVQTWKNTLQLKKK